MRDEGDENPKWTAERVGAFLALDDGIPAVDLSKLKNRVTLVWESAFALFAHSLTVSGDFSKKKKKTASAMASRAKE